MLGVSNLVEVDTLAKFARAHPGIWLEFLYKLIYNTCVRRKNPEQIVVEPSDGIDVLARYSGVATTIAASVPKDLADEIRKRVGKREFSRFVATALARELIDRNRAEYITEMEAIHGPVDPDFLRQLEEAFDR